jgi:hypothetical protein
VTCWLCELYHRNNIWVSVLQTGGLSVVECVDLRSRPRSTWWSPLYVGPILYRLCCSPPLVGWQRGSTYTILIQLETNLKPKLIV